MQKLNDYQLSLLQQNKKYLEQEIKKHELAVQNAKSDIEKQFMTAKLNCLKQSHQELIQIIKNKQIEI